MTETIESLWATILERRDALPADRFVRKLQGSYAISAQPMQQDERFTPTLPERGQRVQRPRILWPPFGRSCEHGAHHRRPVAHPPHPGRRQHRGHDAAIYLMPTTEPSAPVRPAPRADQRPRSR